MPNKNRYLANLKDNMPSTPKEMPFKEHNTPSTVKKASPLSAENSPTPIQNYYRRSPPEFITNEEDEAIQFELREQ